MLEIRGEELKISFPMLATKGNQLTLLDILTWNKENKTPMVGIASRNSIKASEDHMKA